MTPEEKEDLKNLRRSSMFVYKLNKADDDRQKKELAAAELAASGKFPRKGPRKPKPRPATGNLPRTMLDEDES